MEPEEHVLNEPERTRHVGGKDGWYVVTCSCGRYTSPASAYPGRAQSAARDHVRAKTAQS